MRSKEGLPKARESRDDLARRLRVLRRERDRLRKESEKPMRRVAELVRAASGFGSGRYSEMADKKAEEARLALGRGKEEISAAETEQSAAIIGVDKIIKSSKDLVGSSRWAENEIPIASKALESIGSSRGSLREIAESGEDDSRFLAAIASMVGLARPRSKIFGGTQEIRRIKEDAASLALDILLENFDDIERKISSEDIVGSHVCLQALDLLAQRMPEEKLVKYIGLIKEHEEVLKKGLLDEEKDFTFVLKGLVDYVRDGHLFYGDTDDAKEEESLVTRVVRNALGFGEKGSRKNIFSFLSHHYARSELCRRLLEEYMSGLGLELDRFLDAWWSGSRKTWGPGIISKNLESLADLEQSAPGAPSWLSGEWSVFNFARYPKEVLERAFEEREEDIPYGIVIMARADEDGSLYQYSPNLKKVMDDTPGFGLRLMECESGPELLGGLKKMDERYGQGQKISFVIFGGHGRDCGIELGQSGRRGSFLRLGDISRIGAEGSARIVSMFVDDPEMILLSCSTGVEPGIAQEISKKLKASVHAPDDEARLCRINTLLKEGKPRFEVEFLHEGDLGSAQGRNFRPSKIYRSGVAAREAPLTSGDFEQ